MLSLIKYTEEVKNNSYEPKFLPPTLGKQMYFISISVL